MLHRYSHPLRFILPAAFPVATLADRETATLTTRDKYTQIYVVSLGGGIQRSIYSAYLRWPKAI
jgi:hypothetical protein